MQTITMYSFIACKTVFRICSCKLNNRTVVVNRTELQSVQDAVHLGHHVCTVNKDSLVADGIDNSGEGITCSWVILVI